MKIYEEKVYYFKPKSEFPERAQVSSLYEKSTSVAESNLGDEPFAKKATKNTQKSEILKKSLIKKAYPFILKTLKNIKTTFVDAYHELKDFYKAKKPHARTRYLLIRNGVKSRLETTSLPTVWVFSSTFAFIIIATFLVIYPTKIRPVISDKYSIYASKPLKMGLAEFEIYSKDARAQRINEIYKEFGCPLEGLGEVIVYEADKNNIPWWAVPAISFQESGCGKVTPDVDGVESYNAWGWAVYGDNVQMFDNWVRGIETVSEYLSDKFYSEDVSALCEIMRTYTPPSQGSWCEGVEYFGELIVNYKTSN